MASAESARFCHLLHRFHGAPDGSLHQLRIAARVAYRPDRRVGNQVQPVGYFAHPHQVRIVAGRSPDQPVQNCRCLAAPVPVPISSRSASTAGRASAKIARLASSHVRPISLPTAAPNAGSARHRRSVRGATPAVDATAARSTPDASSATARRWRAENGRCWPVVAGIATF